MSEAEQQQQDLMAHQEALQLHRAGLRSPDVSSRERARVLETVLRSDLDATDDALNNLKAQDFPLSNYDEVSDTTEFKWMSEILDMFAKARYPHPQSGLQGTARAWASGNSSNDRRALRLDHYAKDESFKMGTFSRAKRGEGMAQQENAAKQVKETHAVNESGGSGGGGLRGRYRRWRS